MIKNEKWFAMDIAQIESKLKTNAASGLSRKAARSRRNKSVGRVFIPKIKTVPQLLGELAMDFAWILLLLLAVLSLLFDDFQRGISVLGIACIHFVLAFWGYYRLQRTVESIRVCFRPRTKVIRGGHLYEMDGAGVVPGDVVLLERGDVLCADVRLVTSESLRVSMRIDREHFVTLDKYAGGAVPPNALSAESMTNMVHAGSVVEEGSARGIVTAVGKYTYLAARTGGIEETEKEEAPLLLQQMKQVASKLSMISLLSVLPFCLLSLLIGHWRSGDVLLSSTFLTALAITASFMPQLFLTLYRGFFVLKMRRLLLGRDATAVRSVSAMEALDGASYLFVLDGAALSDGRMHFDVAATMDGEITRYDRLSPSADMLSTMTALYCMAGKRSLSVGVDVTERLSEALNEFCERSHADRSALAIRYPKLTYFPGNAKGSPDSVRYIENGKDFWISITPFHATGDILEKCTSVLRHGEKKPLQADGSAYLQKVRQAYVASGKQVLTVSVWNPQEEERIFVGFLVLRDGTDPKLRAHLSALRRMGMCPIFFSPKDASMPDIPSALQDVPRVSVKTLRENNLPIAHQFGKYLRYDDATEEDILLLLRFLHKNRKKVAVLAFSDSAPSVMAEADCVISCCEVSAPHLSYTEEEKLTGETSGHASSMSCLQSLKASADVLISRPHEHKGGIGALCSLRAAIDSAYWALSHFWIYGLCAQWLRILTVVVPMLLGDAALDARHILFCGFGMDLAVLAVFCVCAGGKSFDKPCRRLPSLSDFLVNQKSLLVAVTVDALAILILPRFVGWLGFVGPYLYKIEFSFLALVLSQLVLFVLVKQGTLSKCFEFWKERAVVIYVDSVLVITVAVYLIPFAALLLGIVANPLPYVLLSMVPAMLSAVVYFFLERHVADKNQK